MWGASERTLTANPNTIIEQDVSGYGGGLRAGFYVGQSLFLAADGTYLDYKMKPEVTTQEDITVKHLLLGGSAGFHLLGLRFWGGYYFKNEQELAPTPTVSYSKTYTGTAWKAGVSMELFWGLNLAFEYIEHKFDHYKGNASEQTLKEAGIKQLDFNTYFVSLTLPIGGPGKASPRQR